MSEYYELHFADKIYHINNNILIKIPFFKNAIDGGVCESNLLKIDRSSKIFDHVYAYIIDEKYPYPYKYYTELDFYGITYDINNLYQPYTIMNNSINDLTTKISIINIQIDDLKIQVNNLTKNTNSNNSNTELKLKKIENYTINTNKVKIEWCTITGCDRKTSGFMCDHHNKKYDGYCMMAVFNKCNNAEKRYKYCKSCKINYNIIYCNERDCRNLCITDEKLCYKHLK
jgi:hypothetical protein